VQAQMVKAWNALRAESEDAGVLRASLSVIIAPCSAPECGAFIMAYDIASEHFTAIVASLQKLATGIQFKTTEYQALSAETEQARADCEIARDALRVHNEGHQRP
jgi:hypothetical protein